MKKAKLLPKKLISAVASKGKKKRNEVAPKIVDQNETVEDSRQSDNQKGEVSLKTQDQTTVVQIQNRVNVAKPEDGPCCSHCSSYSQPDDEIIVVPSSSSSAVKESIFYQQRQKGIGIYYANDDHPPLLNVEETKVEEKSISGGNDRACNKSIVQSSSGCSTSPSVKSPLSDQEPCSSEDPVMNDDHRRGSTRIKKIPISEARAKTYLAGHHFHRHEMMNDDEIRKFFPDGRAVVYIGTYNVAEKGVPAESLRDWLLAEDFAHAADIYAIGIQEAPLNSQDFSEWESKIQQCLNGCRQVLFHSVALGVQHLAIFVRRELIWFISSVDQCSIYTRTATKLRTKGALAVGFKLFGTSLLFISCHLSHGKSLLLRVKDYRKIVRRLDLRHLNLSGYSAIDKVHGVFWFGDLNFRISESRSDVEKLIRSSDKTREQIIAKLLEKDQLRQEIRNNSTFNGFQEGPMNFLPTYKYDIGCDEFDTSAKQRAPAYTDRILYRSNDNVHKVDVDAIVQNVAYNSVQNYCFSDHKPVYAIFSVHIVSGAINIPQPKFNSRVYQKSMASKVAKTKVKKGENAPKPSSRVCCTM